MPAALPVDWNEVRTLALAIGVREAARKFGISEDAVMQRSKRESWLQHIHEARAALSTSGRNSERDHAIQTLGGSVSTVSTAADAMGEMKKNTKFFLATAAEKATKKLAEMDPDELLLQGQVAVQYTKVAATVHGFGGGDGVSLRLELIARGHGHEASESGPAIDGSITVERETDESDDI